MVLEAVNMSARTLAICAVLCGLGGASGVLVARGLRSSLTGGALAVEPETQVLAGDHIQGERLHIPFTLRNVSNREIKITGLRTSCGCSVVSGEDGVLNVPFEMGPATTRVLSFDINTDGRLGPQEWTFEVAGEQNGAPVATATGAAEATLLGTLRATPGQIAFRNATASKEMVETVELADMLPGDGCRVKDVQASRPEGFHFRLLDSNGPSDAFGHLAQARIRQKLEVRYIPRNIPGRVQETITLVPADTRCSPIQIPVFCQLAAPGVAFAPPGLTIVLDDRKPTPWHRTVLCTFEDPAQSLEIVKVPQHLTVRLAEKRGATQIFEVISASLVDRAITEESMIFQLQGKELRFPVTYLRN
jgi:hypothetical protein